MTSKTKKPQATLIDVLNNEFGHECIDLIEDFMASSFGCVRYGADVQGLMDLLKKDLNYSHNLIVRPAHDLKPGDELNTGEGFETVADAGVGRDLDGFYIATESGTKIRLGRRPGADATPVVCG